MRLKASRCGGCVAWGKDKKENPSRALVVTCTQCKDNIPGRVNRIDNAKCSGCKRFNKNKRERKNRMNTTYRSIPCFVCGVACLRKLSKTAKCDKHYNTPMMRPQL